MPAYRLPLPVSTNDLLRPAFMGDLRCPFCNNKPPKRPLVRFVSTSEAKDFREEAHRRLPVAPMSGVVEVYATFTVDRLSTDIDNRCKSLLDAIKGRLIFDDAQVAELHLVKVVSDDESKHGVVVTVQPANAADHPEMAKRLARSSIQARANAERQDGLFNEKPTDGGSFDGRASGHGKPSDARGGGDAGSPRPRAVPTLPEELQQKLQRLVRPAVVSHRPKPDDEPPEAA